MSVFEKDLVVHPPQPHHNPLVFASRSSRSWPLLPMAIDNESVTPLRQRRAPQRLGLLRAPLPPLPGRERRTAPRFRGRAAGASGTGSSDNAALMSWSDKRAAGDMGQSARWSTSRVQSARPLPLAHAPVTPLAPAHNETLSRRPRPPAPAALLDSSQRVRPKRQSLAQLVHLSQRHRSTRHGPCAARPAPRSAHRGSRRTDGFKERSQIGSLDHESLLQLRHIS